MWVKVCVALTSHKPPGRFSPRLKPKLSIWGAERQREREKSQGRLKCSHKINSFSSGPRLLAGDCSTSTWHWRKIWIENNSQQERLIQTRALRNWAPTLIRIGKLTLIINKDSCIIVFFSFLEAVCWIEKVTDSRHDLSVSHHEL